MSSVPVEDLIDDVYLPADEKNFPDGFFIARNCWEYKVGQLLSLYNHWMERQKAGLPILLMNGYWRGDKSSEGKGVEWVSNGEEPVALTSGPRQAPLAKSIGKTGEKKKAMLGEELKAMESELRENQGSGGIPSLPRAIRQAEEHSEFEFSLPDMDELIQMPEDPDLDTNKDKYNDVSVGDPILYRYYS